MPKINPSKFERIEFTEEELKAARIFQGLNLLLLKELRGSAAEEKLQLKLEDPRNPLGFIQEEAELQGRIHLLNELIGD